MAEFMIRDAARATKAYLRKIGTDAQLALPDHLGMWPWTGGVLSPGPVQGGLAKFAARTEDGSYAVVRVEMDGRPVEVSRHATREGARAALAAL